MPECYAIWAANSAVLQKCGPLVKRAGRFLKGLGYDLICPFIALVKGARYIYKNVAASKGFAEAVKAFFRSLWQGVKRSKYEIKSFVNHVVPVAAVFAVVLLINGMSKISFALSVEYEGQQIGYVSNEAVYTEAETMMQSRIIYEDKEEIKPTAVFKLAVVNGGHPFQQDDPDLDRCDRPVKRRIYRR